MAYKVGDCIYHIQSKQAGVITEIILFSKKEASYVVKFKDGDISSSGSYWAMGKEKCYSLSQLRRKFVITEAAQVLYGN